MTTIEFRAINEAQAQKAVELINGKTYYNFNCYYYSYPCKGNEFVVVETKYEGATEMEVFGMVAGMLVDSLK